MLQAQYLRWNKLPRSGSTINSRKGTLKHIYKLEMSDSTKYLSVFLSKEIENPRNFLSMCRMTTKVGAFESPDQRKLCIYLTYRGYVL